MNSAAHGSITRVVLRNYKSIGHCDVRLGPLTYLVGPNGAGKSNFLDALHFLKDAVTGSLDHAISARSGIGEVRRRSSGHPTHFGLRVEFMLPDRRTGHYAFNVAAQQGGSYQIQKEHCAVGGKGQGPYFEVQAGRVRASSESVFPALTADRLALVAASGLAPFRPVFDLFEAMGFYNLNPNVIRELQKPQDGRLLKPAGENFASVLGHLERTAPDALAVVHEYLRLVMPGLRDMARVAVGPMETVEFRQNVAGAEHPWRFLAHNMSDGTLRATGILLALFQRNPDHAPTLIGIEEPETALHPGASAALRSALLRASRDVQVIVTSHSPDLLDDPDLDTDSLLSVVANAGNTEIAPIDRAARQAMQERLFSAGELLRQGQLGQDQEAIELARRQSDLFAELP